jgi:16S rRNA (guanine527-N7)-methyltransferase
VIADGCAELGLTLSPGATLAIERQARLLLAWNPSINLSGLRTVDEIARLHVLDSLTVVGLLRGVLGEVRPDLLDLGSGGGYPGLPVAVALPAGRATLLDSVAKKVRFLRVAAAAASMALSESGEPAPEILALRARAEDLGAEPGHRGRWDVVTARAVGSLAELAELALPLLRRGGLLVAWKRDDGAGRLAEELRSAAAIVRAAGGGPAYVHPTGRSAFLRTHRLVLVVKERSTPQRFPRRPTARLRGC